VKPEPAMLYLIFQREDGKLELIDGEESDDDLTVPVVLPEPLPLAA
jgi:hypothetical protein